MEKSESEIHLVWLLPNAQAVHIMTQTPGNFT